MYGIFIENENDRKIQNTEIDIFKYIKDRFNNELSEIIEFNEYYYAKRPIVIRIKRNKQKLKQQLYEPTNTECVFTNIYALI